MSKIETLLLSAQQQTEQQRDQVQTVAQLQAIVQSLGEQLSNQTNQHLAQLGEQLDLISKSLMALTDESRESVKKAEEKWLTVSNLVTKLSERAQEIQEQTHKAGKTLATATVQIEKHSHSRGWQTILSVATATLLAGILCVFRPNPATIPAGKRPAFRFESGHRSGAIRPVEEVVVAG
jgi:predicted phage tail protein